MAKTGLMTLGLIIGIALTLGWHFFFSGGR